MNKQFLSLLAATVLLACSCQNNPQQKETDSAPQDTVVAEPEPQPCVADTVLTAAAQYYSGIVDATKAYQRMAKVDSILVRDMSDMQKETTYLFYPFFKFATNQRADRRADKYITVFPYLCRKKEGLTAGGQPIAPSRLRVYAPL